MTKAKPILTDVKFGFVGFLILGTALIGVLIKWKEFYDFFIPNNILLNWRFVLLLVFLSAFIVWFIMNYFWRSEFDEHQITKKERDNFKDKLRISEDDRLTDVITGIPNSRRLKNDIDDSLKEKSRNKQLQFILIDLKDFRLINNKFGYNKTNDLLRTIAQSIYKGMRRNENLYYRWKRVDNDTSSYNKINTKNDHENFYRVYPGGDEFVFIIEGRQTDALGFSNRLVGDFEKLSLKTEKILGQSVKLSFHCSIVEMDPNDTYEDIFLKAEDCYKIAKQGRSDFTICWHPVNIEKRVSEDEKKLYAKTRQLFEVMTMVDKEYN